MRRTTPGLLAFIACFALAAPSVEAEPPSRAAQSSEPASECSLSQPPKLDSEVQAFVAELRREHAQQASGQRGDIIVLNNRGYNYGPPPPMQLDLIRAEAIRASGH